MKLRVAALLLALLALAGAARADVANEKKVVQGMTFYLGIVPSELVRDAPSGHGERSMHGGTPARPGRYHVMVAVFDAATGERVTDASIEARVAVPGANGQVEALEPMLIVDDLTYGNFFALPAKGPFAVVLRVSRPGLAHPVVVRFEHAHR